MKNMILLLGLILATDLMAGTCTSISRTNNSANAILTSTKYNTDHNTAYSAINAFDGGCITDGTLEDGALNTTDFNPLFNGLAEGCAVTASDTNTLSISACRASVNGNFVNKTSATTATWGCTGCASEVASTTYYLYMKSDSAGSTITPIISTTAPNADGYDNSSNKVVGKFRNNGSSDIETANVGNWIKNRFVGFKSAVRMVTGGGYGSTNTKIQRFTTTNTYIGDCIDVTSSTTLGTTFTIAAGCAGRYTVGATFGGSAAEEGGISINATPLTTTLVSLAVTMNVCLGFSGVGQYDHCGATANFAVGDALRVHNSANGTPGALTSFYIVSEEP